MSLLADRMAQVRSDIRGPLFEEALRMQAEGQKVLKLNTGNPGTFGFPMPPSIKAALSARMDEAVPYCDLRGMPDARRVLLDYHLGKGVKVPSMEDVFIGNGISELALMLLSALLNPGDELLVPAPVYTLWSNSARMLGARPVYYRCDEQSAWYPDVADIVQGITPRTRALLIINPNNPTGALYPREVLEQLLQVAREHNLLVISDEIYDRLVFDGQEHISTASLAEDITVVTLNGLSKSHNICGFRCGWMVLSGPAAQVKPLSEALGKLAAVRLCGNALTQLVIPAAMGDDAFTRQMMNPGGRLYEQRKATMEALNGVPGLSFVPNAAAFYLFPRLDMHRYRIETDQRFCMDLLHETGILVIPGSGFDLPTHDHLRIVMLPEADILRAAMGQFAEFLARRAR